MLPTHALPLSLSDSILLCPLRSCCDEIVIARYPGYSENDRPRHRSIFALVVDLQQELNLIVLGGDYGDALQAASLGGHTGIVQLLLSNGANVYAEGGEYSNALYATSLGGHTEVVQVLLDIGANINAEGGGFGNAL
ncbi:hypothetical protein K431DRAFT_289868 [Polychaeton citri CBS 116435]|uniref:Ankyrin n=1 Tax=Polychaeton citri CBS 116435 TaxID=1314669 RepID=A0A9P4PXI0_9PEZI|nr:hypothetical protein K431DRAFT_289868 [Polychaeton citri CBS 116435]